MDRWKSKMISWADINYFGKEVEYVTDALNARSISSSGKYTRQFEQNMCDIFSVEHSLSTSNGTVALQLAFMALGIKPGDKIIVPAYGFHAATNVLLQMGAELVFCDIDNEHWNQTLRTIKKKYTNDIKGIVLVYNWGACGDVKEIIEWSKSKNIWVVEDCAEAWFSKYEDKYLGTYGDIATFSMHAAKTITSGEGGVVITNNNSYYEHMLQIRSHGLFDSKGSYKNVLPGNNFRLSNLHASIACAQTEQYKEILLKQLSRESKYRDILSKSRLVTIQQSNVNSSPEYWATGVKLPIWLVHKRNEIQSILRDRGVDTRTGFCSVNELDYISTVDDIGESNLLSGSIIVLPCSLSLSDNDAEYICNEFLSVIDLCINDSFVQTREHLTLLENFYTKIRQGQNGFRFFDNRDQNVVKDHLHNELYLVDNEVAGYSHLDVENEICWLGIALEEKYYGTGLANIIMDRLVSKAKSSGQKVVSLSVDYDNTSAIKLYEKFGFVIENKDKHFHMTLTL